MPSRRTTARRSRRPWRHSSWPRPMPSQPPGRVAGAVAGIIREDGRAELQAIGAGAVNQAIKAIAISRSYLSPQHMDIVCVPTFMEVEIDHSPRTGMRLVVQRWDFDQVHSIAEAP